MRTDSEIKALAEEYSEGWGENDDVKAFLAGYKAALSGTERVECYLPCGFSESEIYAGTEAGPLPLKLVTLTVVPNHQS